VPTLAPTVENLERDLWIVRRRLGLCFEREVPSFRPTVLARCR